MKKILLVLSLMMASVVNVNAQGTYRGFLDVGPSIGNGFSVDVTTAHGWQFNKNWFLGAGVGLVNIVETDNSDTNEEDISLPIFAKVRFDNLSEKALTFFADANLGYCVLCEGDPLYASFMVGLRQRLTARLGLNFGIGFSIVPSYSYGTEYSGRYWNYYEYDESAYKFNIKVGIDF